MHLRVLFSGLLALAAAAALTVAGSASATVVSTTTGGAAATPTIHAVNEGHVTLVSPIGSISCASTLEGTVETHGEAVTTAGKVATLTFTGCTNSWHVTTTATGSFALHHTAGHNGTLTSSGTRVSATKLGITCNYETNNTSIGYLTGGNPATLHVEASIPIASGSSGLCGSSNTKWEGSYVMTSGLYVAATGGSSPTSTSLSTSLKGGGKEGASITVDEGDKVKDTATLSGTNAYKATGTVKYKVFADSSCKELVTTAGEVTVTAGSVPDSGEVELTAGATYYWQAEYSGDSNNQSSVSVCSSEVLSVKADTTVATSLSGEGQSGPEVAVQPEAPVFDTATLSGTNASKASGTIEYEVYEDDECEELAAEAGGGAVTAGKAANSSEVELPGGIYYWQAHYSGDATHQEATSVCGLEVQIVAESTSLSTSLTGRNEAGEEVASGEEIEVLEGTAVSDSAFLSGSNAASATGYVSYKVYEDEECEELVADAGVVALDEESNVPPSGYVTLPPGTYYWRAEYSGDFDNLSSVSPCGDEVLSVEEASLSTSLSGGGESGPEIEVQAEEPVVDTATLNSPKAATATGTIEYEVYEDDECEEPAAEAGKLSLETEGKIPPSEPVELPPGTYYWEAVYSGDLTHPELVSRCYEETMVVAADTTLTTLLSGGEESGKEIQVVEGTAVSDSATLTGAFEPTGEVEYKVYEDDECEEFVAHAGGGAVEGEVIAGSDAVDLPVGTYYWQATYLGDLNNQIAQSPCGDEVLTVVPDEITTSLSGGGESGPEIEVLEGEPVTDTATLNIPEAATATGTIEYKVYEDEECEELVAEAGKLSLGPGGKVPSSNPVELPAGTYYWQAHYSGDESHEEATSACGVEVQWVRVGPPTWIVSVGDSYISGEGGRWAGNVFWDLTPAVDRIDALGPNAYKNPFNDEPNGEAIEGCHRSRSAEIFIGVDTVGNQVNGRNLACSGALTFSYVAGVLFGAKLFKPGLDFVNTTQGQILPTNQLCPIAQCKGQAQMLKEFATQRKAEGRQLRMIVVSIGGNNFGFPSVVAQCAAAYAALLQCNSFKGLNERFEEPNLKARQGEIKTGVENVGKAMVEAGYAIKDFTIVVQDYPSPLPKVNNHRYTHPLLGRPQRLAVGRCPFGDADLEWANTTALGKINETVRNAAAEAGANYTVKVLELQAAINGRRLCEKGVSLLGPKPVYDLARWTDDGAVDKSEWMNQLHLVNLPGTFTIEESLHPNYWGQLAFRNCVRKVYNVGEPIKGECVIEAAGLALPPPGLSRWEQFFWPKEPKMKLLP